MKTEIPGSGLALSFVQKSLVSNNSSFQVHVTVKLEIQKIKCDRESH